MKIGEKIKERRTQLGWSLRDLSSKMGYANHSTIARIESGQVDIPQSKIERFSRVLDIPLSELMGWEEETPTVFSPTQKLLIDKISSLSDEECQKIIDIINIVVSQH